MATPPYRTYSAHPAEWDVSWLVAGAGVPTAAEEYLLLRQDNTGGGAHARAAAGFRPTYPAWTTEGNISAYREQSLAIYVEKPVSPCDLEIRFPAAPLTAGMTVAALNAAWAAGTAHTPAVTISRRGWYLISGIGSALFPNWLITNGVLLGLNNSGMGSFIYDATLGRIAAQRSMIVFEHWTWGGLWPVTSGMTYADYFREDVSALEDYLYGLIPAEVRVTQAAVQLAEQDTTETSINLVDQVQAGGSINLRASTPEIENWASGTEPFGTLSLAKPGTALDGDNMIDASIWSRLHGTPVRFALSLVRPDNGSALATLATIRAQAGHAEETPGAVDIELLSPAQIDLDGALRQFWATEAGGVVEFDTDPVIVVLWHLLLSACPRTHWDSVLYWDWSWLGLRFGGTFGPLALDATETAEYETVRDLFDALLPVHALCCGTDLSGNVTVWHPAAYRPSMRVHTLDPIEEYAQGVRLEGLEQAQYDALRLTYNDGVNPDDVIETVNADRQVSNYDSGRVKTLSLPTGILGAWGRYYHILQALGRQMAQRLCYPAIKLSCTVGLPGLTWRLGDQLVVTSDIYGLDAVPFMVTAISAAPMSATADIEAVHYTGWPGGHSLFSEAGPRGIWRWRNERGYTSSANKTLANMTWNPSPLGAFALGGPGSVWTTSQAGGTWEAALMYIEETGEYKGGKQVTPVTYARCSAAPSATLADQVDIQLACPYGGGINLTGRVSHDWVWRWWNTATGEGLALLLQAPSAPNPDTNESIRLVLAHCSNCNPGIGGWAGVITASLTLPYGFSWPSALSVGEPALVRSISVAWDAEDSARVYDGQRYIGTLSSTPAKGAAINAFDLRTPALRLAPVTYEYLMVGLVRLTQHLTTPPASQMLPHDGLDPVYL